MKKGIVFLLLMVLIFSFTTMAFAQEMTAEKKPLYNIKMRLLP